MQTSIAAANERWAAANELIRAADDARVLADAGRITQADVDRRRAADERWTRARNTWPVVPGRRQVLRGPVL